MQNFPFGQNPQRDSRNEIYVSNLEEEINEQILYNIFNVYGIIKAVRVMRHLIDKRSRGFAFITFQNEQSVQRAIREMNGKQILNNKIKIYSKNKYKTIDKEANVFISKIPKKMSQKEFEEIVNEIGDVFSIKFNELEIEDYNTAYVQYEQIGDAKNAISYLNDKEYYDMKIQASTTSKKNIVFIKGKNSSTLLQELKEILQNYGDVMMSEKILGQQGEQYIISLRFITEQKAKNFMMDFHSGKFPQDLIQSVSSFDQKESVYKKFKKDQGILYLQISPIKEEINFQQIFDTIKPYFITSNLNDKLNKLDMEEGERTFQIVFTKPGDLIQCINFLQSNTQILNPFITQEQPIIKYPNYLIKIIKKQTHQSLNNNNPYMNQGMMMNPMMQMNPMMPNMNPMNGMQMNMMPNPQMGMQIPNPSMQINIIPQPLMNPQQMGKNSDFFMSVKIIEDNLQDFEKLSNIEQKKVFRILIKDKMKEFPDIINQEDTLNQDKVLKLMVDEEIFENDELIQNLSDDKMFRETIQEAINTAEED